MKLKHLLTSIALIACTFLSNAQVRIDAETLTTKLQKIQDIGFLPGYAVAVVTADGVIYQKGFGYADTESKTPFTINSLQNVGSISKTLTGVSLMKLVEEGKLSLDTPINDFLPSNIYNPYHSDVPIIIKHLATHTSSIIDPEDYERTYLFSERIALVNNEIPEDLKVFIPQYNNNISMSVIDFIENMIHPLGKWYSKKNFSRKKPGTEYNYSNMGAAIAGYIIEQVSGKTYMEYTKEIILEPLKMKNSGWNHDDIDMSQFVSLYLSNNKEIPHYSLISYADGGLITSVNDMALYFSEMIKGYNGESSKVISHDSYQQMMHQAPVSKEKNTGIFWQKVGRTHIGHTGGDPGIMTFMTFDPDTGYGYIVFTNKFDPDGDGYNQLVYTWKTLQEYMDERIDKTN
jgi:CubicO group peptidase (beta-lactamase class C family)